MVYRRYALAFALMLAACPDDSSSDGGSGSSSNASTPTSPTADGTEGPCPDGGSLCGNECKFLGSDNENCGACGNVCNAGEGEVCIGAECLPVDPCEGGPGTACGAACVTDFDGNNNHCGECFNNCDDGEVCSGGDCVPGGGSDPTTDPDPTTTTDDPTTTTDPGSTSDPGGSSSGGAGSTSGSTGM